jgi:phosphoribosylanthranilate isomerase
MEETPMRARRTRIQIFGAEHRQDALALAELGIDHLGFCPAEDPILAAVQASLSVEDAKALLSELPSQVRSVLLFATPDPDLVGRIARSVRPDYVQICWGVDAIGPAREAQLRADLDGIEVIKEIGVSGPESRDAALSAARRYEKAADILILDSQVDPAYIGATGRTHDWSVSRAISAAIRLPCILAGGLGPDNVEAALRAVHPWGVDSYSRTNRPDGRKDLGKTRAFVEAVRRYDEARRREGPRQGPDGSVSDESD